MRYKIIIFIKPIKVKENVETPLMMLNSEISFKVKKSKLGRTGWKIMPEDETMNLRINKKILDEVLDRIR